MAIKRTAIGSRTYPIKNWVLGKLLYQWAYGVTPSREDVNTMIELSGRSAALLKNWADPSYSTPTAPALRDFLNALEAYFPAPDYNAPSPPARPALVHPRIRAKRKE